MFEIGIFIGLYAYVIYFLGLLGMLYRPVIWIFTILFLVGSVVYWKKKNEDKRAVQASVQKYLVDLTKDKLSFLLSVLLIVQILINFIGVLGPELGFDALWYHLTLPKIYLMTHAISFIPGGLFYYSTMPKLLELLYVGGLSLGSAIFPKLIHFSFGILTLVVLYTIARKFFSKRIALLTLVIFYANLVVGWESISAYIDLGRTFYESLSLLALLEWLSKKDKKLFFYSALFIGFAITTKLLAIGSLVLLLAIIWWHVSSHKEKTNRILKTLFSYIVVAIVIPLPWLVLSLVNTSNPLYPFFSHTYPVPFPFQLFNPLYLIGSLWNLFLHSADPINPIYIMVLPLIVIFAKKWPREMQYILFFAAGGLFFWYITPQTGGGRFILPYLPVFSLVSIAAILSLPQKWLKQLLVAVVIVLSIISIGYRCLANAKFIPVIFEKESKSHFLATHLNFSFGDFVDSDGYFAKHIKPTDTVLLYGFHNEFYVDVKFIDSSYVKKGDVFNYIAVQNGKLPKRFQNWTLIYTSPITHVSLYSAGGIPWTY